MKNIKCKERGITILALVVTIIVLLILAGVAISFTLGEDGILRRAQDAVDKYKEESENELIQLNKLTELIAVNQKATDIYVFLYSDGTLTFGTKNEVIEGKDVLKEYGNIKGKKYNNWLNKDNIRVSDNPWYNEAKLITKVEILDNIIPLTMSNWFACLENLIEIKNIENIDTSECIDMEELFFNCISLENLNLSTFETSKVTNMAGLFASDTTKELEQIIGLENFNTSNVTNMSWMFYNCNKLTSLNLSSFDTSNVVSMSAMFAGGKDPMGLKEIIGIEKFNTNNVKDMSWMFQYCSNIEILKLSNFNTSKVKTMSSMFRECTNLKYLDMENFNTSNVTDMSWMFYNCNKLISLNLSNFDTSNVINMEGMFSGSIEKEPMALEKIVGIEKINTINVENMASMFQNCHNIEKLDLSNFNTSKVKTMSSMFMNCSKLKEVDLSNFNTSLVTDMGWMFNNCNSLEELNLSSFDTSNVVSMSAMFAGSTDPMKLKEIIGIEKFNTNNVKNMKWMFQYCSNIQSLDLGNFNTKKVTDMSYMFTFCQNLKTIYVGEEWDLSNVEEKIEMFTGCGTSTTTPKEEN